MSKRSPSPQPPSASIRAGFSIWRLVLVNLTLLLGFLPAVQAGAATLHIVQILDATGDGAGHSLDAPQYLAVDANGNLFVAGNGSDNAFKLEPGGAVTQIIDATSDGTNALLGPMGIAVDSSGNVFLAGNLSDNVFKIEPGGAITQIMDSSGDGMHAFDEPYAVAVDASGNVYVAASGSDNVFEIEPGGAITQIIDASGDGTHPLDAPRGVAVDGMGNVYVCGMLSDNAFEIASGGVITQIIDATGDGLGHPLDEPHSIAVDPFGNVFTGGHISDNAFKIEPGGTITEIIDSQGNGVGAIFNSARAVTADTSGNAYVASFEQYIWANAYQLTPTGEKNLLITGSGDGQGHELIRPEYGLAVDSSTGAVYVAGRDTDNVFMIEDPPPREMPALSSPALLLLGLALAATARGPLRPR